MCTCFICCVCKQCAKACYSICLPSAYVQKHFFWLDKIEHQTLFKTEFVRRKMFDNTYLTKKVWQTMFDKKGLTTNVWQQMFDNKCLTKNVWQRTKRNTVSSTNHVPLNRGISKNEDLVLFLIVLYMIEYDEIWWRSSKTIIKNCF